MAVFTVTNAKDSGAGSLRAAIAKAEQNGTGADTIKFAPGLAGKEITLKKTLVIKKGTVTIDGDTDGDGEPDVTISGDKDRSDSFTQGDVGTLLTVGKNATASLFSLGFSGAYGLGADTNVAGKAGGKGIAGIVNSGQLSIESSIFSDFRAVGGDGGGYRATADAGASAVAGIINSGTGHLTVTDSIFQRMEAFGRTASPANNAPSGGEGITGVQSRGESIIRRIVLSDNVADGGDGGEGSDGSSRPANQGGNGGDAIDGFDAASGSLVATVALFNSQKNPGSGGTGYESGADGQALVARFGDGVVGGGVSTINASVGQIMGVDDVLVGNSATFAGLFGDDVLDNRFSSNGRLFGGGGNDILHLFGGVAQGLGGTGNDSIFVRGTFAGILLDGGRGFDQIDFFNIGFGTDITLNMQTGVGSAGPGQTFTATGFERFVGADNAGFSDNITGTKGKNEIFGLAGDDTLRGGNGADSLDGGAGDDILDGGRQNDLLIGGADADLIKFGKKGGKDIFLDFEDNVDTIQLNDNLWKGTKSVAKLLKEFATLKANGEVVLDFGQDEIRIKDAGSINILKNDIEII